MNVCKINIHGRVQGVRFRKRVFSFFKKRNLTGSVENLENGSVKVLINCNEDDLNEFKVFLKNKGLFLVKNFEVTLLNKKEDFNFDDFKIIKRNNFLIDQLKSFFSLGKYILWFSNYRNYLNKVPLHIAIIPDGNRRWAKKRGLSGFKGHERAGRVDNLIGLFEEARKLGVKYVSFWGFSTENWKRDKEENENLFNILLKGIREFKEYAHENKIRFRHVGIKTRFSNEVREALIELENETKNYSKYNIQLCLDYGGRDEILRCVNKLLNAKAKRVNEKQFLKLLDTKDIPPPDLIIRTSGEKRLSGFMPYQGVYAELIFIQKHFPSFKPRDVRKCLKEYSRRKRTFGGN